jgi:transcriptional regulator with XRE-family HTH domain
MPETNQRQRHHAASSMTPERYRKIITKLGMSQRATGRFLGLSDTQSARMALGTASIPPPIAMLLELLAAHDITPEAALKLVGINVTKAEREAKAKQINKAPRFFRDRDQMP